MMKRLLILFAGLCALYAFTGLFLFTPYALGFTSTIEISKTPFLFFQSVPDSFNFDPATAAVTDTELTSDNDGVLADNRLITIEDTRGCGGFVLQLDAATFAPAEGAALNNTFRAVSSSQSSASGAEVNGVKYLDGFSGDQTASAPLNVSTVDFSDPALFTTSPFDDDSNILNQTVDLISGDLTSSTGRIGQMQMALSFYLNVPKYFTPGTYYSTLTFTLTDSTQGTCS